MDFVINGLTDYNELLHFVRPSYTSSRFLSTPPSAKIIYTKTTISTKQILHDIS